MLRLVHFLKQYKKQVILGPLFKLLEAIFELTLPTLMILIIDKGVKNKNMPYIFEIGALMLLIAVTGVCCAFICQYYASIVSQGFGTLVRNALFEKISSFSYNELDKFGTPSLINRITNDVNQLQLAVAMLIRLVIRVPFLCIGGLIMAMLINIKLSIILLLVLPLFSFVIYIIMKISIPLYKNVQKKLDKLSEVLRENLSGVRVIRAFVRSNHERERFKASNVNLATNAIRVGNISALINPATNIIINFSIAALLWFGGIEINIGEMTQGQIIAYINYITLVLSALIVVANLVVIFTKASASAARVNEIFETDISITDSSNLYAVKFNKDKPIIEFKDVCFSYNGSKEYALNNLNFKLEKGETIGIIGGTGAGKTTLINLISRFYDATAGNVLISGTDIKAFNQREFRKFIGLVPQNPVLFSGTIRENICWGLLNASEEQILRASEIAQASSFIENFPQKYETNISQGGINLSGGQKQRLTIARALVKNPQILILDDASSALDYATDSALRKFLRQELKAATVIMVTQRINTIKNADKIIVLEDGGMSGFGTHGELMNSCTIYREIYNSQQEKEVK